MAARGPGVGSMEGAGSARMSVATPRTLGGEVRVALEAELVSDTAASFSFVPRPITGVVEDDGTGVAWGRRSGGGGRDGGEGAGLLIRGGRRRRLRRLRRRVLHDRREGTPAVPAPAPVASARVRALSIPPPARQSSASRAVPGAVLISTAAAVASAASASAASAAATTRPATTAATSTAAATAAAAAAAGAAAAAAAAVARVGRGGGRRAGAGDGREGTRMVRREAKAAEVGVEEVVTGIVVRGRLPPGGCEAIGDPGGLGEVAALGDG